MVKYKQQVLDMLEANKELFESFSLIHAKYVDEPQVFQEEFNQIGQKAVRIIQRWENMLCSKTESGKYGKFSQSLSENFWKEIRMRFPKIDYVGVVNSD